METGVQTNDTSEIDARRFPCLGTIFKRAGYATGVLRQVAPAVRSDAIPRCTASIR